MSSTSSPSASAPSAAAIAASSLDDAQKAQLAGLAQGADGRPRDLQRFPLPRLEPAQGFRVDPALVYAMARQESNFDPRVVSPAGARGLETLRRDAHLGLTPQASEKKASKPNIAAQAERVGPRDDGSRP